MDSRRKHGIVRTVYVVLLVGALFGWLGAEKGQTLEYAVLFRTLQLSQDCLRGGDPAGLAAELARCEKALHAGLTPYRVLLEFRSPEEAGRRPADSE